MVRGVPGTRVKSGEQVETDIETGFLENFGAGFGSPTALLLTACTRQKEITTSL